MAKAQRVVVVTGGGSGIGRAIAERLVEDGCYVVVFERDASAQQGLLPARSERVLSLRVDVASEPEVADGMAHVRTHFGQLDGLVNNAGIADPAAQPIELLSLEAWRRVIDTNLSSMFLCAKHAVSLLRGAEHPAIVNISSTRALQSEPNTEAYAASKGGIVALTHALALSLGPKIRVNAISPGWIDTRDFRPAHAKQPQPLREVDHAQHPVGRVGHPNDIASLAAYLLSNQAGFISGQNFVVDGGMTRKMIYAE
jgi:NAD(P)-dependent dehydrogenase (short-subunit alcohol dehydrogenase family)